MSVLSHIAELTVPEKILLAADQLEKQGQSPFSAESLIVASWQQHPRTFGLKGYADQYPDSNKVLTSIMGEKGLARRGWLVKMGQKLYSLTREGKHAARKLLQQEPEVPEHVPTVRLRPELERRLVTLLDSTAVQKFEERRKNDLTFADACKFWNITENMFGDEVRSQLDKIPQTLTEVGQLLGGGRVEMSTGRSIGPEDLVTVTTVHSYLLDKFSRHLTLLRTRTARP